MTLAEAAAEADALAEKGDERALSQLRSQWEEEVEHAARSQDFRERAVAYRAIAQFRYRQKIELLRRGREGRPGIASQVDVAVVARCPAYRGCERLR